MPSAPEVTLYPLPSYFASICSYLAFPLFISLGFVHFATIVLWFENDTPRLYGERYGLLVISFAIGYRPLIRLYA